MPSAQGGLQEGALGQDPGVRYVADQSGFLPDEAPRTAADIFTANANVDALYATNEGGTLGALKGIRATRHAGRTVILGSDIGVQIADAMLAQPKTLVLTVGQDAKRMGRVAVQQALRAVRGQQIAQFDTYIPTTAFTSDNPQGLRYLAGGPPGRPGRSRRSARTRRGSRRQTASPIVGQRAARGSARRSSRNTVQGCATGRRVESPSSSA